MLHAIDSIGAFSRPGATTVQIVTCTRNEIAKIHWRFNFCGLGTLAYSNRRFEEVREESPAMVFIQQEITAERTSL